MNKIMAISTFSLCLLIGLVQSTAFARTDIEIARDLDDATNLVVAKYRKEGMAGLITETKSCYERTSGSDRFYCVYIDIASRRVDQIVTESMQWPPNDFFYGEQMESRVGPVLSDAGIDTDTANRYLAMLSQTVNDLIGKKL